MPKRKHSPATVAAMEAYFRMGHTFNETAEKFNVPPATIRQMASRNGWTLAEVADEQKTIAARVAQLVTETWAEKAEAHRRAMFKLASEALSKATPQAPKNWRDIETADKIARRAAGLDDDGGQKTLVQLNLLRSPEPALPGE